MTELRKRFEALPEIPNKLEHLFFEHGFYYRKYDDADQDEYFVNGAWCAFQEQQKKIDEIVGIIHDAYMGNRNSPVETIYNKIKELLK